MASARRFPYDDLDLDGDHDLRGPVTLETWLGAPARSFPNRPPTLPDALDRAVRLFGDRTFLVEHDGPDAHAGRRVGYAAFADLVAGAVERLAAAGLGSGDRFAVAATNGLDLAVAHFAAATGGFVLVGLNVRLAPEQWAYQLAHSGCRLVLAQDAFLPGVELAAKEAGLPDGAVARLDDQLVGDPGRWSWDPATQRPDEAATYAVVYTSGTTGRPKASQVVHRCSIHSGLDYHRLWQPTTDDVAAVVFPLYYISAMHAHVLPVLLAGGTCVLVDEPTPPRIVEAVRTHRVTMLYVVPALWPRLLKVRGFAWPEVDHLRLGAFGGAHMPLPDIAAVRAALPQVRLHDVYGLSETHSPACMLLDGEMARRPGSVGRPLACMEARVVGDDDTVLGAGEPGELELRGSLVTTGYLEDPAATAEAIRDGWFRTGDVARIDAEGYVTILDRRKEMINRGGNKVFSAEVERVLRDDPRIADVAVVPGPDRAGGESVCAFVVRAEAGRGDGPIDATAVRRIVSERIATHASPRVVEFVDALPRNSIGKVDKPLLRERAAELRGGPAGDR